MSQRIEYLVDSIARDMPVVTLAAYLDRRGREKWTLRAIHDSMKGDRVTYIFTRGAKG